MDRDSGSRPLLRRKSSSSSERKRSGSGRLSLSRRNSVNALRHEFVSKLPEKVLAGIDAEAPFEVDTSKTKALSEGIASCSLLVFVGGCLVGEKMKESEKETVGWSAFYYHYIINTYMIYWYVINIFTWWAIMLSSLVRASIALALITRRYKITSGIPLHITFFVSF